MQLGSPLGAAPRFNIVLHLHFPEYPEEDKEIVLAMGENMEIREDERLICTVKLAGLYNYIEKIERNETSNSSGQSVSDEERLSGSPEVSGP